MISTGRFTPLTHEMNRILKGKNLTLREQRVIQFLHRHIHGYRMTERVIKTSELITGSEMIRQSVHVAVTSLLKKGAIIRTPFGKKGEYIYEFNQEFFGGRTYALKTVNIDPKIKKKDVTSSVTKMSPNKLQRCHQYDYKDVTSSVTSKILEAAPVLNPRVPKESIKERNKNLKEEAADTYVSLFKTGTEAQNFQKLRDMISNKFPPKTDLFNGYDKSLNNLYR